MADRWKLGCSVTGRGGGCDYCFDESDVRPEVEFDDIRQGDSVACEVRSGRSGSRAKAAR